jgi:hypothetical protein
VSSQAEAFGIAGHDTTEEEIRKEMGEAGFDLVQIEKRKTRSHGVSWLVVGRKP